MEDLATNERTNLKESQNRSLSHQLVHITKMIKTRVGYGIVSSEHDFKLSSRDDDHSRGEEFHSLVDIQFLLINTMSLVHSRWEETSNQSCSRTEV